MGKKTDLAQTRGFVHFVLTSCFFLPSFFQTSSSFLAFLPFCIPLPCFISVCSVRTLKGTIGVSILSILTKNKRPSELSYPWGILGCGSSCQWVGASPTWHRGFSFFLLPFFFIFSWVYEPGFSSLAAGILEARFVYPFLFLFFTFFIVSYDDVMRGEKKERFFPPFFLLLPVSV